MVRISGSTIVMTRADTLETGITILDADGNEYVPQENDVIRFALRKNYNDENGILIYKVIPHDTMLLRIDSSETRVFQQPGTFVWDLEITIDDGTEEGFVDTFMSGKLKIRNEVDQYEF